MCGMSAAATQPETEPPRAAAYQPLVIVLVAASTGIMADRLLGLALAAWWTTAGVAWVAWIALWRRRRDRTACVLLLLSVAACAGLWHHLRWSLFAQDELGRYARPAAQPACVEAIAIKGPRRLPAPPYNAMRIIPPLDRTRIEVKLVGIRDGARWRPASGRARLTVDGHLLGVYAGDRLRIFAQLSAPRLPQNPGDFNYAAYHRTRRRLSQLRSEYPDCVTVVGRGHPLNPRRWIDHVRSAGRRLLRRYLDERRAELAATVLLGAREEIGTRRMQAFTETGTVHLLAISGLHVGIVAGALFLGLRLVLVPRSRAVLVVAAATVLYTVLTDARPPAIRATILVLMLCASTYLARRAIPFNSLAAAALVVLVLNPADLFGTGVQLSFIAVAGLMWFAPDWLGLASGQGTLDRLLLQSRPWPLRTLWVFWRGARYLMLASVMIWLVTLPLVMARFHVFTPVGVVLNTLLWLPMAFALVSGFGVLVFGWLLRPLGAVFGWCSNGSLWLLESCVQTARDVPLSHFWVPGPANWWLVGFYGGLGALAAFPAIRPPRRWCLALLAGWIAIGFMPAALRGHRDRLECTFLSVGHGCAVLIELPSGQTMLYDAGQFGSSEYGARSVAASLWSRGITHLDAVLLSHADADHYNMLADLLERFSVGVIYVSPVMFQFESPPIVALHRAIQESGVPVREVFAGDRLQAGDECLIEVLHPPRRGLPESDNANSIVLAIEYRGRRMLLPGDLETPGLDALLAEEPWDCDVLLAPHHGSRRSDPPGLSAWCTPEWVIISGSVNSYQPETAATYRAAGAQVLHTAEVGAVNVTIAPAGVEVKGTLKPD